MTVVILALLGGVVGGALLSDFGGFVLGAVVGGLAGWVADLAGRVRMLERRLEARKTSDARGTGRRSAAGARRASRCAARTGRAICGAGAAREHRRNARAAARGGRAARGVCTRRSRRRAPESRHAASSDPAVGVRCAGREGLALVHDGQRARESRRRAVVVRRRLPRQGGNRPRVARAAARTAAHVRRPVRHRAARARLALAHAATDLRAERPGRRHRRAVSDDLRVVPAL